MSAAAVWAPKDRINCMQRVKEGSPDARAHTWAAGHGMLAN